MGELLTRWTVRLVVACYLARLFVDAGSHARQRENAARWFWTAGCGLYLVHVACAFHFYHGWSHSAAWEHTARRTAELTGLHWGGGLLVNYAFTLVWLGDVVLWWRRPEAHRQRSRRLTWVLQAFMAFIIFNATVVFGPPFWKWAALPAIAGLAICRLCFRAGRRKPAG